jgi:tellurite resistance protein TerB
MAKQYPGSSSTTAERASDYSDQKDQEIMQALVTAGALVALADGRVDAVERDELVNFIDRQRLAPAISQYKIAEAFDNRVRRLEHRDSVDMIVQAFQPLAGRSLASTVIRTAERVAAADRQIHRGEVNALKLIRLLLMTLPANRSVLASHAGNPAKRET